MALQWQMLQKIGMCYSRKRRKKQLGKERYKDRLQVRKGLGEYDFKWEGLLQYWTRFLPQRSVQKKTFSERSSFFIGALPEQEGLQDQAGPDVDPVGTTTPRALGHHCQGFKATGSHPHSNSAQPPTVRNWMFAEPENHPFHTGEL